MEKKNELAKEERTIFIVLAIIIMIAIGVLITWYFTKDKDLEDTDKDTSDKVVDKQPKKDISDDTQSTYVPKTEEVIVSTTKLNDEEEAIAIVDTSESITDSSNNNDNNEEETGSLVPSIKNVVKFDNSEFYLTSEIVDFATLYQDDLKIANAKVTNVLYNGSDNKDAYKISNESMVEFLVSGDYTVTVVDDNNNEYVFNVTVMTDEEFKEELNIKKAYIDSLLASEDLKYYDQEKLTAFRSAYENFVTTNFESLSLQKISYLEIKSLLASLEETKDASADIATLQQYAQKIAEEFSEDDYTALTYAQLKEAIEQAGQITGAESNVSAAIKAAYENIAKAIANLEKKDSTDLVEEEIKEEENQGPETDVVEDVEIVEDSQPQEDSTDTTSVELEINEEIIED